MKIKTFCYFVLYGCKTWSVTIEHKLRVFQNRVLMRIFGPKKEEVRGGWRKLLSEELHNLYSSLNIRVTNSRWVSCTGPVAYADIKTAHHHKCHPSFLVYPYMNF
jgi:hypothetical protein